MGSSLTFKIFTVIFFLAANMSLVLLDKIAKMKEQEAKINAQKFELEIKKSNLEIEILNYQIQAIKGDGQ